MSALRLHSQRTLLVVLIIVVSFSGCSSHGPEIPITGESYPYTKVIMFDGTVRALGEYKGKTVVVLFWATWCSKSRRAVRHFNEFAKEFARRSDIVFLAANIDDIGDAEKVQKEMKESRLDYLTHAFSGNSLADEAYETMNGEGIPYFVLIDRNGRVALTTDDYDVAFEALRSSGPRTTRRRQGH